MWENIHDLLLLLCQPFIGMVTKKNKILLEKKIKVGGRTIYFIGTGDECRMGSLLNCITICPRSSDPFNIVTILYKKGHATSWTDSTIINNIQTLLFSSNFQQKDGLPNGV